MNERPVKINRQRWFSISIYKFNLSLDLYCTNQVRSQDFTSGVGEVGESYEGALCLLKKLTTFLFLVVALKTSAPPGRSKSRTKSPY